MERAARLFRNNKYSRQILSDDDIVRGIWRAAVGRSIARHTSNLKVVRAKLVVEVGYDHFTGGRFRHGTRLIRWRPDKAPEQCRCDQVSRSSKGSMALLEETGKAGRTGAVLPCVTGSADSGPEYGAAGKDEMPLISY